MDFSETQKFKYLENEALFLQIEKFIPYTVRAVMWHKSIFPAELTKASLYKLFFSYSWSSCVEEINIPYKNSRRYLTATDKNYSIILFEVCNTSNSVKLQTVMITVVGNSIFQGKSVQVNLVKTYLKSMFWLYFEATSKILSISNIFNITKKIVKANQ